MCLVQHNICNLQHLANKKKRELEKKNYANAKIFLLCKQSNHM